MVHLHGLGIILPFGPDQSESNIVENGIIEEKRFLLHQANLRSPPLEVQMVNIVVVD